MAETKTRNRTLILMLLTLVYGFNFIDRQIVGILAPWIQADLNLTNTQLGLLVGLAFASFYTIMGIPLAFLADRMNRVTLLSIALAVWSGFTALTGMAQNFLHIALARVGVGIGEAGGSPPSHSMISDSGALGVYALGIPLGVMAAYFFTAALMGADAEAVNWRRIFIILGATGLILAIIVKLAIREPERGAMEQGSGNATGYIPLGRSFAQAKLLPRIFFFGGHRCNEPSLRYPVLYFPCDDVLAQPPARRYDNFVDKILVVDGPRNSVCQLCQLRHFRISDQIPSPARARFQSANLYYVDWFH